MHGQDTINMAVSDAKGSLPCFHAECRIFFSAVRGNKGGKEKLRSKKVRAKSEVLLGRVVCQYP